MSGRGQDDHAASALGTGHLTSAELEVIAVSLRELAQRLEGFWQRLAVLDTTIQASSGSTSRSTRARRSSTRSRSS
jgi:hypothetical protein